MIALGILYAVGLGALIAGAAAAVEWAAQGRMPARHLWTIAIVATVVLPPIAVVRHSRVVARQSVASASPSPSQAAIVEVVQLGRGAGVALGSREQGTALHSLRTRFYYNLDRIEHVRARTVVEFWAVASLALLAWVVAGLAHWQRERQEWEKAELDGVNVHLSDDVGPAVLGIIRQHIVLPAWARTLAPEYRELMLAHECEHIAARDPQRLALAIAALVVMPWNPALWWCAARMRRAIEVDCDARVLRQHPSPREYGYLLLQVAARGTNAGPLAMPLVNLLRLPSELELRLRAMTRPRSIAGRTALAGVTVAGAALTAAFTAPVPRIPALTSPVLASRVLASRVLTSRVLASAHASTRSGTPRSPRAWVRMRDSVVELDSVTVDPVHDITRGVLPPGLRRKMVRDTLPSARAEDSLRYLARALAERSREVDSLRARMDSLTAAAARVSPRRRVSRIDVASGGPARIPPLIVERKLIGFDSGARASLQAYFRLSAGRIDAALKRYYPNLASDVTPNTVIWFLADSAGNVIRTVRKEESTAVSPVTAASVFGNVDAKDIGMSSIRNWNMGDRRFAVAWIELKR